MLGTLPVPFNLDPNPAPDGTASHSFGFMATSNFYRGGRFIVGRKSGIQRSFTLPANSSWFLNFDWAFLSGQLNTGANHNDFAVVQLLAGGQTIELFRISRDDLQPGGQGPGTSLNTGSCGSTQFGSAPNDNLLVTSQFSLCTGWQAANIDVSRFAGQTITVQLFVQEGGPDNDIGTFFAFDNLKFNGNAVPVVSLSPPAVVAVGTATSAAGSFSDGDQENTHTARWAWGDGTTTDPATLTEGAGSGSVADVHSYAAAGVYPVTLTVTDNDGGSGSAQQSAVVYDPAAGFVAGLGWINSPAVPSLRYMAVRGNAAFALAAKYLDGNTIPQGLIIFEARNMSFVSARYEWLVVAGGRAQFKGVGKVNGAGSFGFLLTATDGALTGDGRVDRLRIKIWDRMNPADPGDDVVVYDNQYGAADGANPTAALGGGSIAILRR
jgi:hypothetical protein